jgi:hypothetical protein
MLWVSTYYGRGGKRKQARNPPSVVCNEVCVMPVESVCAVPSFELRQDRSSPLLARVDPGPNHALPQQRLDFLAFVDERTGTHLDLDLDIHRHVSSSYSS